jgi:hypothetical protein
MKSAVTAFFILLLCSCAHNHNINENQPVETNSLKDRSLGVNAYGERATYYTDAPAHGYYYGRLHIETTLKKPLIADQSAQSILDHWREAFHKETYSFAVTMQAAIGNLTLPRIPLFDYVYDENASPKAWKSHNAGAVYTPWVRLDGNTQFTPTFQYVSSDQKNLQLVSEMNSVLSMTASLNPGTWVISSAISGVMQNLSNKADKAIANKISGDIDSTVTVTLIPVTDKIKFKRIILHDVKSNAELAVIDIHVEVTNSLLDASPLPDINNAEGDLPQFSSLINPLTSIFLNGEATGKNTLKQDLKSQKYYTDLLNARSSDTFGSNCNALKEALSASYSLNIYDQYFALRTILASTPYAGDPNLQSDQCLDAEEQQLLTNLNIPLSFSNATVKVNDNTFNLLADFMKQPSEAAFNKLLPFFTAQVSYNDPQQLLAGDDTLGQILRPGDVLNKLAQLKATSVGCYQTARRDNKTGRRLAFTLQGNAGMKILEAFGVNDIQDGIRLISIRNATPAEAAECGFDNTQNNAGEKSN